MGPIWYRGADAMILTFSLIDHPSFEHLGEWLGHFKEHSPGVENIIICGTKCDLIDRREVTHQVRATSSYPPPATVPPVTAATTFLAVTATCSWNPALHPSVGCFVSDILCLGGKCLLQGPRIPLF